MERRRFSPTHMTERPLPAMHLGRHGETAWTVSGQLKNRPDQRRSPDVRKESRNGSSRKTTEGTRFRQQPQRLRPGARRTAVTSYDRRLCWCILVDRDVVRDVGFLARDVDAAFRELCGAAPR
jgi:hypothetical protein